MVKETEQERNVRNGIVTEQNGVVYKTVFFGKNFHVYRLVDVGVDYRGNMYQEEGWALAWSDISEYPLNAPSFVSLRW